MTLTVQGVEYTLNPFAISCIRYRRDFGASMLAQFAGADSMPKLRAFYARMVYSAMDGARPDFGAFARSFEMTPETLAICETLRRELMAADPCYTPEPAEGDAAADEYDLLYAMGAAGLPWELVRTLPMMHIYAILGRGGRRRTGSGGYRKMTASEMAAIYR